ncbi:MAG: hypothetical protein NTW17_00090 [Candidatus Pacearchaeota archaeon]|nr:hypothetical protein [Candidatus Pacearchaeota archaeon]
MVSKENLVVLAYAHNECYTILVRLSELEKAVKEISGDVNPKDLNVNLEKRTWSFGAWRDIPIGHGRTGLGPNNQYREGIIGIYHYTNYEHVVRLVCDAQNAVERPLPGHALCKD